MESFRASPTPMPLFEKVTAAGNGSARTAGRKKLSRYATDTERLVQASMKRDFTTSRSRMSGINAGEGRSAGNFFKQPMA